MGTLSLALLTDCGRLWRIWLPVRELLHATRHTESPRSLEHYNDYQRQVRGELGARAPAPGAFLGLNPGGR